MAKSDFDPFAFDEVDEPLPFGDPNENEAKVKKAMQEAYENATERVFKEAICECPLCKEAGREGKVYEGENSYYCNHATNYHNKECHFVLYKNNVEKLIRRDISPAEVKELCENGSFSATCTKIQGTKQYTGIFTIKDKEKYIGLNLGFPEKEE